MFIEPVKHLSWGFLQKKLIVYIAENNFRKKFHLRCLKESLITPIFTLMNPNHPTINTSPKLQIRCEIPVPSFIILSPTLQLSYGELRYLKQFPENYQFCRNSGNDANGRGWDGRFFFVIMKHCERKSICVSPLNWMNYSI